MKPLVLLPLVSCLTYVVLATVILARDSRHPASRLGAAVCASAAWWALCEVLWTTASDPRVVMWLVKLSSLGWLMIGSYVLHLFLHVTGRPARHLWKNALMPCVYGLCAVFITLELTTSLLHETVVETSWGWAYTVGPLFPIAYLLAAIPILIGVTIAVSDLGAESSRSERRQIKVLLAGIAIPLAIATYTDCALPIAGEELDAEEIRSYLRDRLSAYKVPRVVLFFAEDEIQFTGNQKIQVGPLRAAATTRLERDGVEGAGHRYAPREDA